MTHKRAACSVVVVAVGSLAWAEIIKVPEGSPTNQEAIDAAAQDGMGIGSVRVATGLENPVFVTHAPGDTERLFILEQHEGRIRILDLVTGALLEQPFLDLDGLAQGNEQGLLGLAFHPCYDDNGYFYVNLTNAADDTEVRRYTVSKDPDVADPDSAHLIIGFEQPTRVHNAGWLGFGPLDGYLYIATGEGGNSGNAQDITDNLLGKILRLDVDGGDPYAIPADNPFVGGVGDDEIWAYGLRNPWRMSFDRETGDLYIGDVGQNAREEIDFQPHDRGGLNYGWRCMEGTWCTGLTGCTCDDPALTDPIHEYGHDNGCAAVIGGYVYRGCDIPTLRGTYFFAELCDDNIWTFRYDGENVTEFVDRQLELAPDVGDIDDISSFGEDANGELYVIDRVDGEVFKIIPDGPTGDVDCNGVIDFEDLLRVLVAWGPCEACPEDLNGDGQVNFADLLVVLSQWTT